MLDSRMRGVAVLGSTGSVGRNTISVLSALGDRFKIIALSAGSDQRALQEQIDRFNPTYASIAQGTTFLDGVEQVTGDDHLKILATLDEIDIVVVATTGHAAIPATLAALAAGKIVALANKETIVAAGQLVMPAARSGPGELRPVDSEHSAIWQCLEGNVFDPAAVCRIVLTASGGPFRGWSIDQLCGVTPERALNHPTWSMGSKITIDSATLMNKGFELIEAHWLFDCPMDHLDILVHPQSIVHSLVEYNDGSLLAQLASHDMRLPIQYALTYPERPSGPCKQLRLEDLARLEFELPDLETFPLIEIAREAVERGGTYPAVLSAADSVAVRGFLNEQIGFLDIAPLIERTLDAHKPSAGELSLEAIFQADKWASQHAEALIRSRGDA